MLLQRDGVLLHLMKGGWTPSATRRPLIRMGTWPLDRNLVGTCARPSHVLLLLPAAARVLDVRPAEWGEKEVDDDTRMGSRRRHLSILSSDARFAIRLECHGWPLSLCRWR